MSRAPSSAVYKLKASLCEISPMIWRRLLVPGDLTLHGLHRVVQIALGWEDYHLHAFNLHGRRYGIMWTGERHRDVEGREIRLADLKLRRHQRILYEYARRWSATDRRPLLAQRSSNHHPQGGRL